MAKKKDPFEDFAEKMLSGPKVSETPTPAPAEPSAAPQEEPVAKEPAVSPTPLSSPEVPVAEPEKKGLRADHKAFTVYLRNDILVKLKTASFKSGLSSKAIINQALEEFFDKHKGML